MKKYTLLSHGWQKTGLVLLAFCALLSVVCFKAIVHDLLLVNSYYGYDSFGSGWAATALVLCFTVGVVLLALSRERAEDERVSAIRHQSLIWTVILYVAIVFLSALSNLFLFHYIRLMFQQHLIHLYLINQFLNKNLNEMLQKDLLHYLYQSY